MEALEMIKTRRSIRKYVSGKLIKEEDLLQILEMGMLAPSARNVRPYEFIVVQNKAILEKLVKVHPYSKMILDAGTVIILIGRPDLEKGICGPFWQQDLAAVAQNILLSANAFGYGTCWCGCYPNEERADSIKNLLSIKKGIPFCMIAIGIPDEKPSQRGKFELDKVTFIR